MSYIHSSIPKLASPVVDDVKKRSSRVTFDVADDIDVEDMIPMTARLTTNSD